MRPQHRQAADESGRAATLTLQRCDHCGTVQYPPREICTHCLSDALTLGPVDNRGRLLATSELHHSLEAAYRQQLPWPLATVLLDCGVRVLAHNPQGCTAGTRVSVATQADPQAGTLLVATAADEGNE